MSQIDPFEPWDFKGPLGGSPIAVTVRGYAWRMEPINKVFADALTVIADQFDGYKIGFCYFRMAMMPYWQDREQKRFIQAYAEWHGLEDRL